ncbi:hypothetical protein [Chamaesiphon minutus]|uniref:Uncharacterized protein n=1 Tax=Chamaesiphon minutus (strain ATCC 27169 / PCC 6605) TaxID=1173020 RepID=K9UP22_CHAP6|nr:hypothetical protein [Chamaesiphon minutus]AFY95939.1 hypothetical protein Cha6605_5035 [Chamaesiphon minutus PCC 6605]
MEHFGFKLGGAKREIARKPSEIESKNNLTRQLATIADERQITNAEASIPGATNTGDPANSIDIADRKSANDFKLIAASGISVLLTIGSIPQSWIPNWLQHPVWQ